MHSLHLMHRFDTIRCSFGSGYGDVSHACTYTQAHRHCDGVNKQGSSTPCVVLHPAFKASIQTIDHHFSAGHRSHTSFAHGTLSAAICALEAHVHDTFVRQPFTLHVCALLPGVDRHTVCMLSRDFQTLRTPLLHPLCPAQPDHHCHFK